MHVPTGNDERLFRHLFNHYDDAVYRPFLQLHRRDMDSDIWTIHEQLTAIAQALNEIQDFCKAADSLVEHIEADYEAASKRMKRWLRRNVQPIIEQPTAVAPRPKLTLAVETAAAPTTIKTSPIPDQPPRLPPLPFQTSSALDPIEHSLLQAGDARKRPTTNKSFSAVEEQVSQRKHFRSATMANARYVADNAGVGFAINHPYARQALRGPAVGIRRKGSVSSVPRVFGGSFSELENDIRRLKLDKVKTPEEPPSTPVVDSPSPIAKDPVKVRDFADASGTSTRVPSPAPQLQRREAVASKDVQWESRILNGEMVRVRRPSEKLHRAQTINDHTGGFEGWLGSEPQIAHSTPGTPPSAVKRGLLRQRENTL